MTLARFGYVSAVTFAVASALVVVLLVAVRIAKDRAERRRLTLRAPVWRYVLMLSSGEDEEIEDAYVRLLDTTTAERAAVEADAFALLPKLRGDARQRLREVLRAWGSTGNARHRTTSRSAIRRCRGYYRLGVLAEPGRRAIVVRGLEDRDFIARRVSMLALGSFPDPEVVDSMLERTIQEPALRRDFLASIDRIGGVAVRPLMGQLERALAEASTYPARSERRGQLAAEALGLVGAVEAVNVLESSLAGAPGEMQVATINALGQLGSPTSVRALSGAVLHESPDVRRVAADALGLVGGTGAVTALATALVDDNIEVARAAANGLQRCGSPGRRVLIVSDAPVAREVLALADLGGT